MQNTVASKISNTNFVGSEHGFYVVQNIFFNLMNLSFFSFENKVENDMDVFLCSTVYFLGNMIEVNK